MGDLDDWLLEAAGRTSASGATKQTRQPSRRRHQGSYSDDDSSSEDDLDDGTKYSSRKPSGSRVPLKKRSNKSDAHKASLDEDQDSDDSDVGSDLYKDEDDRERLANLTELDRELILSERAAKKDDKKMHKQMLSRWKSDNKAEHRKKASPPSSHSVRTSARYADRSAAKVDALNELRERRMKRDPLARNRSSDHLSTLAPSQSESGSDSDNEDDEGSMGDGRMDDSEDERVRSEMGTVTFEDIKSITIRRSKLAKWFMEPFFEELIVGCFVRVGIGMRSEKNIYRLCLIQNVDSSDPNRSYQFEKKTTHKFLNCVWGSERSAARWQMAMISDSPPSKEDFEQWAREVERHGGRMPSRKEVKEKKAAIDKANNFVYSAETVKQMLELKKASSRPLNIAAEREKLRREMEKATENKDKGDIERIGERIKELEEVRRSSEQRNEKALKLQEMNRKNRVENFKTASGRKRVNPDLKAGEAGYDPFSRRWTRSQNYYVSKSKAEIKAKSIAEGNANTDAAQREAAGSGKLVDTHAPVDQGTNFNTLHGFELPICLAPLESFGGSRGAGSAFMARKQRIEATVGCQVHEDDGREHLLTLTVGDYKRRRGLL